MKIKYQINAGQGQLKKGQSNFNSTQKPNKSQNFRKPPAPVFNNIISSIVIKNLYHVSVVCKPGAQLLNIDGLDQAAVTPELHCKVLIAVSNDVVAGAQQIYTVT